MQDKPNKIKALIKYYKTTAFFESLLVIKNILTKHSYILKTAMFIMISISIFSGKFTYKFLFPPYINTETSNKGTQSSNDFTQYIYVTVSGEVKNPGMYEMTADDRVNDAIIKAGGFTEKAYTQNINLAQLLSDEQYINIMSVDDLNNQDSKKYAESDFNGIVNINTATADELCQLPGIGEATAKKIIEYRDLVGGYDDIRDIQNVNGIGTEKYNAIKNNITI